jgi:hypothetical protein
MLELALASPGHLVEAAEHFVRYNLFAELNAVVLVAGLACLVSGAIRRSVPHLVLLLAWLASFAAAWLAVVICGFDVRQFIVSTTLSYVAVSGCCDWAVRVLAPLGRGAGSLTIAHGVVIALVLAACTVGVGDPAGGARPLQRYLAEVPLSAPHPKTPPILPTRRPSGPLNVRPRCRWLPRR